MELLDSREEQLAKRSAVGTAGYAAISRAMVLLGAGRTNQGRASQTSSIQSAAESMVRPTTESAIGLPPISLPEFDGDYKGWLNYRDTLIHLSIGAGTSRTFKNCFVSGHHCEMERHRSSNRWRRQPRITCQPGSSCVGDVTTIVEWPEGTSTHCAACRRQRGLHRPF